jgi:hypothetical protein
MNIQKVHKIFLLIFVASIVASAFIVRTAANWLTQSSSELNSIRGELSDLSTKLENIDRQKKVLATQASSVSTLSFVLPKEKDQARALKEIEAIANQANVTIESVGFPSSTLGSAQTVAPKTTADTTAPSTTSGTSTGATATPTPSKPTKVVSQATPLKDIPGVQSIELSIGAINSKDTSIKGVRYDEMLSLLKLIERNRRTMQIRSIGIGQTETAAGKTYSLTLSIVIFIQP